MSEMREILWEKLYCHNGTGLKKKVHFTKTYCPVKAKLSNDIEIIMVFRKSYKKT